MSIPYDPEQHCGSASKGRPDARCRKTKGWGTNHNGYGRCKLHGGASPLAIMGAERAKARDDAQKLLVRMGQPVSTDPQRALLELVWEAAGNVAFLREKVQELQADAEPTHGDTSGLVGPVMGIAQREGYTLQIGEEVRAIVRLYGEWTDKLAKYSKTAIDAGIAERQVRLAEAQGYAIRDLIESVLDGINATAEQQRLGREIAGRGLRLLAEVG